jgi:hypothetical protein
MGSVSSANPGVTNLLQILSNLNSPVLSSSAVTSALTKASTADIVQLSMAATQLENVDVMFGISSGTGSAGTTANAQTLSAATSNAASADQLATEQTALQSAETSALLYGTGATGSTSGSLFDLMG